MRFSRELALSGVLHASATKSGQLMLLQTKETLQSDYFWPLEITLWNCSYKRAFWIDELMWKINSSACPRNIRTVSCCCGRSNCAEPRTRNTKISSVPFLLLNRKLCEHKLRNQTGSLETWTLPNPRHGRAGSALLLLAVQRNTHGAGGSQTLNVRIWTENQHLSHAI